MPGPVALKPVALDLYDLIEYEAAAIAPTAAAKNLTVGYSLDPAVPRRLIGSPDALSARSFAPCWRTPSSSRRPARWN